MTPLGQCPTCDRRAPASGRHQPFCSARCKMVDLGRWFHEEYVVAGEPAFDLEGVDLEGMLPPGVGGGGSDERDA